MPGIEALYRRDDGRETWAQIAAAPLGDGHGDAPGEVMLVVNDIDAGKRAEAALRGVEARQRTILAALREACCVLEFTGEANGASPACRLVDSNPAFDALMQGEAAWLPPELRAAAARVAATGIAADLPGVELGAARAIAVRLLCVDQPEARRVAAIFDCAPQPIVCQRDPTPARDKHR